MSQRLPLEGLKIIELSTYIAVPVAGRILADWGAEVIKVEDARGDAFRGFGYNYGVSVADDENPLFSYANANKKMMSIDLKSENGQKVMYKMLEDADVFLTNVRPAGLKKLGLDYESIKGIKEDIIYADFTGYGTEGEEAIRPGFDIAAYWCRSGALLDWVNKGDKPMKPTGGFGDASTSPYLASAILAAQLNKLATGEGTHLTTSLLGVGIAYNFVGEIIAHNGYQFPEDFSKTVTPFINSYQTKDDKWVMISTPVWAHAERIYNMIGSEELKNPDYLDQAKVLSDDELRGNLVADLEAGIRNMTYDEVHQGLIEADVVHERLVKLEEIFDDEQARANNYVMDVKFPSGTTRPLAGTPVHFSNADVHASYEVPTEVGRDNAEILKAYGFSDEEINELIDEKTIR